MKALYATQGGGSVFWDRELQTWIFEEAPPPIMGLAAGDPMPEEWGIGGLIGYDRETQEELAWEEHSYVDKEFDEERAWAEHEEDEWSQTIEQSQFEYIGFV